jgi:hypothetical protein
VFNVPPDLFLAFLFPTDVGSMELYTYVFGEKMKGHELEPAEYLALVPRMWLLIIPSAQMLSLFKTYGYDNVHPNSVTIPKMKTFVFIFPIALKMMSSWRWVDKQHDVAASV